MMTLLGPVAAEAAATPASAKLEPWKKNPKNQSQKNNKKDVEMEIRKQILELLHVEV